MRHLGFPSELLATKKLAFATLIGIASAILLLWGVGASFALVYFAVAIYVVLLIMIPGYVLSSVVFKDASSGFRIAASAAVISPVYAVGILVSMLAGRYRDVFSSIFAVSVIAVSLLFLFRRRRFVADFLKADLTHLKWMLLLYVFNLALMALPASIHDIPYLSGATVQETRLPIAPGDQYLPYRLVQILLNGANWKGIIFYDIWQVTDRTPLMGLVAAFVTSSLHIVPPLDFVWFVPSGAFSWNVFQIVGLFLDAQILLSAYLLLVAMFGISKARLAMPFLAINPFIIWNTFYTSPKSMAAYFVLLSLLLILERRHVRAGIMAALGFLSHSYTLFYVIGSVYLVLRRASALRGREVKRRRMNESPLRTVSFRGRLSTLMLFLAPAGLGVAPWLVWSSIIYGHGSSFLVYPFVSSGPASATTSPTAILAQFLQGPWDLFPWVRVVNAFRTLTPWTMAFVPGWFIPAGWQDTFHYGSIDSLMMIVYIFTLPGGLSLSLTIPAYVAWLKYRTNVMFSVVTLPLLAAVLFFGYTTWGLASLTAQPLIPVLIGCAVAILSNRALKVLFATLLVEHIFFIWEHVYPARLFLTRIQTPSDFVMVGVIIIWAFVTAKMTPIAFKSNSSKKVRVR